MLIPSERTNLMQTNHSVIPRKYLMAIWGAAILGSLLAIVGFLLNAVQFYQSYLFSFSFWLSVSLGGLGLAMLHYLTRGGWGFSIQRFLEGSAMILPLLLILCIPVILGMNELYHWVAPEHPDEVLLKKQAYLNVPFFLIRLAVYFGIWILFSWLIISRSNRLNNYTDIPAIQSLRRISAPGLVLLLITISFAAVDLFMSLEYHWFSSIYGFMIILDSGLTCLAFMIVLIYFSRTQKPFKHWISAQQFHDLGNLLLAMVVLWAYLSFMQYLIIWYGNIPEEIHWYLHRTRGGWEYFAYALMAFHFGVPFFLLLLRRSKRKASILFRIALLVLIMRAVDYFWLVMPAFHQEVFHIHWLDVALFVAMGGIWLAAFFWIVDRRPLLPIHDPWIERVAGYERRDPV